LAHCSESEMDTVGGRAKSNLLFHWETSYL